VASLLFFKGILYFTIGYELHQRMSHNVCWQIKALIAQSLMLFLLRFIHFSDGWCHSYFIFTATKLLANLYNEHKVMKPVYVACSDENEIQLVQKRKRKFTFGVL